MRIAMVSEHASPLATLGGVDAGGQNVHVAALSTAVGAAGHQVVVHTRRDDPKQPRNVAFAPGVTVHHVAAGPPTSIPKDQLFAHMSAFADELHREWRRLPPDVVHAHFWMSGWAAMRAARPLGIPVVLTYHALGTTKRSQQGAKDTSPARRVPIETALARACDHIVATSSEEVFELQRMGAEAGRVSLVPCGVDLDHFTARGDRSGRATEGRVLVVSRLVERKGIGNAIVALAGVPTARLAIAGGPPRAALVDDSEAQRLISLARDAGVGDRVELLGRVERADLPSLYRSTDVVACVPWYEPFGLVALEAMACGRPVVATAVGGLIDTVIHGATGLHVPPRDPPAIAGALRRVLDDSAYARDLGDAGRDRARARYGWPTIAQETVASYELACASRPGRKERVG